MFPDIAGEVNATDVPDDTGVVDFGATFPGTSITQTFTGGEISLVTNDPGENPFNFQVTSNIRTS